MKKAIKVLLISMATITLLTACGKVPVEQIDLAKSSMDAVAGEGAEKYAPAEFKVISDQFAAAMAEVKVQDGKFFKNYDVIVLDLDQLKVDADALKTKVAARKEELKVAAGTALSEAQAAVAEAKSLLEVAPQGKGSMADIEAMKSDVVGLDTELETVTPQIDAGEYIVAIEKAHAVAAKAMLISNDIKTAQEKLAAVIKK